MAPANTDSLLALALEHQRGGRLKDTQAFCRQILSIDPEHADAWHLLGIVTRQLGLGDHEAIAMVRQAIACNPNAPEYHANLGVLYFEQGRWPSAVAAFERSLELRKPHAMTFNHLGNALHKLGRLAEATAAYQNAVDTDGRFFVAWNNLGNVLRELDRLEESAQACRRAIALRNDFAAAHNNLANALNKAGKLPEAIDEYRQAIALDPNYAHAHYNLGLTLLSAGQFQQGWIEHEWRLKLPEPLVAPFPLDAPAWDGGELHRRSIVLHAEQGFGDTIHFLRYVPQVIARGGRVTLAVRPELARLLSEGNSQGARIIARGELGSAKFDAQLNLMSLPRVLDLSQPLPMAAPYIHAERAGKLDGSVTRFGKPKIGLVWAGSPRYMADRQRSLPLPELVPLADVPANFFSLQMGAAALEAPSAPFALVDLSNRITDFADTAQLIADMDLVISVDTAVAHLAGAMGKQTWILLPFAPDWRWQRQGSQSPWYPTVRLFRQPVPGDWQSPVAEIAAALADGRL